MPRSKRPRVREDLPHAPYRKYPGWPRTLPCLVCERPRRALWPGDRMHASCASSIGCAQGEAEVVPPTPEEDVE